jgi:hypothetical protein
MARDAIARQYDVDKNRVTLFCEEGKGSYRPGKITFFPKQGKTIDLRNMRDSLSATRLSGGTNMSTDYLDITAVGALVLDGDKALLKVSGSTQEFLLKDAAAKSAGATPLQRLRAAAASGAKVASVSGRVEGWTGRFPDVLKALAQLPPDAPMVLVVADFEMSKKE